MPAEPNQFNYPGSWDAYFDGIFRTEFPEYTLQRQDIPDQGAVIYTFVKDGRTALVTELRPQRTAAKKLRQDCAQAGIPYQRYYYDHEGWWNTRSYVIERTRCFLKG